MGDAGPISTPPALAVEIDEVGLEHETATRREVTVLVTGFGVRLSAI
jgi:hypothetical protein